ncbi:hypothetical protein [Actinomadura sp. NPDC000600]|uniref:hypothetical protein n=1 Tax=Actinomadura sp. NPDC000600 TaxID=3154262 RepID=UPI003390E36E
MLGLDVGPHTVSAGVGELAARRLAAVRRPVGRSEAGLSEACHLLRAADEVIGLALQEAGLGADEIAGVVAAPPGIVDPGASRVLLAPSVPGWTSVDLAGHLRVLTGALHLAVAEVWRRIPAVDPHGRA